MIFKLGDEVKHKKLSIIGFIEGYNNGVVCVTWMDSDYGNFVSESNLELIKRKD